MSSRPRNITEQDVKNGEPPPQGAGSLNQKEYKILSTQSILGIAALVITGIAGLVVMSLGATDVFGRLDTIEFTASIGGGGILTLLSIGGMIWVLVSKSEDSHGEVVNNNSGSVINNDPVGETTHTKTAINNDPAETVINNDPVREKTHSGTAVAFVTCINNERFSRLPPLEVGEAQSFLQRGGSLNVIADGPMHEKVVLRKSEQVITGCTSGLNRSQVAARVIESMGIHVEGVLSGGDTAMNPHTDHSIFTNPLTDCELEYNSVTNFTTAFGAPKRQQIGFERKGDSRFFQDYINGLSQTHFITFGTCGLSVIRRLLERKGSLEGFTITHFPWGDEIVCPPEKIHMYSVASYTRFGERIKNCFVIEGNSQ